ncbi:DUF6171 family protein [Paenibacillus aestuarii]|uniref:DUF6171 family protein n=1 Tax=Paenibacillus aestuarii TaxID=516965 RepID=A0ABW0KC67_9BACL|nr:DUF6171 family protein [Paenibacillus aestuarii]
MIENRQCKSCQGRFEVTEEQITRVLASPMFQSEEHSVTDAEYDRRLEACKSCAKLMSGTTCALCGCIVRIAAKLKERRCPHPGNNRWKPL